MITWRLILSIVFILSSSLNSYEQDTSDELYENSSNYIDSTTDYDVDDEEAQLGKIFYNENNNDNIGFLSVSNDLKSKYAALDKSYEEIKEKQNMGILDQLLRKLFGNKEAAVWLIRIIRFLLYAALIFGVSYLLWNIFLKKYNWRGLRGKSSLRYGVNAEEEDGFEFGKNLEEAIKNNDFRSAVRYYYLLLLYQLSRHELITLHREKTNSDYQRELSDKRLKPKFRYLSFIYDYIWYGDYMISQVQFNEVQDQFKDFFNTLDR